LEGGVWENRLLRKLNVGTHTGIKPRMVRTQEDKQILKEI